MPTPTNQDGPLDAQPEVAKIYGDIRPDGIVWQHTVQASPAEPAWTWHHLDLVNARARSIAETDRDWDWDHAVSHILNGQDETPRILAYGNVIAGVLPSYGRGVGDEEYDLVHWRFVATPNRLLTARRHATRSLANVRNALDRGPIATGPADVLGLALADFARAARARLAELDNQLDLIEDGMLEHTTGSTNGASAGKLGQIRREAVVLRRGLAPVDRGLDGDGEGLPGWFDTHELDAARSAIHGVLDDIAALAERGRSLQDELTSRLADETNRRIYVMSIVTTLVMPATFVTGFFGMNTGGLLWSGDDAPRGTVFAAIACVASVLTMLALLKRKRLL